MKFEVVSFPVERGQDVVGEIWSERVCGHGRVGDTTLPVVKEIVVTIAVGHCVVNYDDIPDFNARIKALASIEKQYEGVDKDEHCYERYNKIRAVEMLYDNFRMETEITTPVHLGLGRIEVKYSETERYID